MKVRRPLIYLVDDDAELRQMLGAYLERNGYDAISLPSGDELLRRLRRQRADLVVLDLMMPGTSGLEICQRLRLEQDDVPIIMLTVRADVVDRIIGLTCGADDYLGKPFDPRELLARIEAVRRRRPIPAAPVASGDVCIGDWCFSALTRSLRRGERVVPLTDAEQALLAALTERPGLPLSRERLLEAMHGRDSAVVERSVDVAIYRLRRLIEPYPETPRYIQTMRGRGYIFVPDAPSPADGEG